MAVSGNAVWGTLRGPGLLAGLLALLCSFPVYAVPAYADTGLEWLATQQNVDGSYGSGPASLATPVQSTAEVVRAQQALEQTFALGFDSALSYLNAHSESNTEFLSRKIVVNARSGALVHGWVNELLTHQNDDGGFGDLPGDASSVFDTACAVEALAAANYLTVPQAAAAVGFLMARQQGNGGWAHGLNDTSVYVTASSMRALWPYRSTYQGVAAALTKAQSFLLSRRGADGLWGEDFQSAMVLLTLVPQVGDLSMVDASAAALQAHQLFNGSWAEDTFTTALALQALRAYDGRKSGSTPAAGGSISGYVVLANSTEPIAGATVTIEQVPGIAVSTNGEGFFVIPGLSAGSYTVTAAKAGHTSASVVVRAEANHVTLAGTLVMDVVSQTGLVRGGVFDAATRQPMLAVQVSLSGAANYSVLTNGAGEFDFGPVAPGAYTLRFEKNGYHTLSGTATAVAGQTLSTQLGMSLVGGHVDDAPGTVSGRVVDGKTGQPIVGAVFDLGTGMSATTGADGAFSVTPVPRTAYQGTLSATGYRTTCFSLVFSPGASGDVGTVSLFPQSTNVPPTSLTLRGLIADGVSGAPIAGASVTLVETGASVTAGADGRFVLSGITLKDFNLAVGASGYTPDTYALQVAAYGEAEVTLKLSPPGNGATASQLAGVVTDAETGAAIAGAQVSIAGTALRATTGSDGSFSLGGIDKLELVADVSAVGYVQQSLGVKLAAHGNYPFNPVLKLVPGESFQVVAVSAQQAGYGANATALFTARIASLLPASKSALVLGEVQDATGATVATVRPYAEGTTTPASQFVFAAGELKELTLPWNTAQFSPGSYRLVVRVSEPGTISGSAPFGEILAENAARTSIVSTLAIDGAMAINPPLTQAGLPTPVSFTALVLNAGNTPLPAGPYLLAVKSAKTGATLFTTEATGAALAVGGNTQIAFGTWVPSESGNLPVSVRAKDTGIAGSLADRLYVGDKASGTFTVDLAVVPEGNQTVRGEISMQGVDTTQGGSTDPLYALVKSAVKRAGVYTATETVAWHGRSNCLGCHIQTQSLLGLSSAIQKAEIDTKATQYLYNAVATSQWADGVLRISNPGESRTQTALGLWSLGAWADLAGSFRTRYKAAQYLNSQKSRSGDKTFWSPDHASGWWNTNVAQTALTVKGFVDVLQSADKLPAAGVADYTLVTRHSLGSTRRFIDDLAAGSDGSLYIVRSSDGIIHKVDLETGTMTAAASNLGSGIQGVAVAADGTLYVTRNNSSGAVIKIRTDGTRVNLAVSGNITDAIFGPDGWLYLSDWNNNRILRLNAADQVEVYVSGGLLNRPNSLEFDADGDLLVTNQNAYNILEVAAADKAVSKFAEGLAYQPVRMMRGSDGSLYVTTISPEGLIRVRLDGSSERVLQTDLDLQGVAAHAGRLYVVDYTNHSLRELQSGTLNADGLTALRAELPYAVRYLLANTEFNEDNVVHAMRLIGLAEAGRVLTDATLLAQLESKVTSEAAVLRSRQRADGGWSRYTYVNTSDPLVTAMVGIALEYTNPSPTDPQIRNAIQFLLNKQRADGSWDNFSNGLSTRLAATSFVMVFMPKALDRLGGIDIDLYVELPSSIQLSNASTAPTASQPGAGGSMTHLWKLPGVTGAGREVAFDLGLLGMALGEQRPAATRAWLEFKNSFVDEKVQLPLTVPVVSVTSGMALTVALDKAHYLADEPVAITSTVKNISQLVASGSVALAIRAAGGTQSIAVLPPQPFTGLAAGAQLPLMTPWNTGATLAGDYEVYARLLDTQGRVLAEGVVPFDISAPTAIVSSTVVADRPVYDAWDVVNLTGRVRNTAVNAVLAASRAKITVKTPTGETLYSSVRDVNQLMPGGVVTLPYSFKLADAASGTYPVTLVLEDAFTRAVLSTSTTSFQVERRALRSLTGTMTVESPSVYVGELNACTDRSRTVSSSAVAGVTLIHRLLHVDSGGVVDEATETVELSASGLEHVYTRGISTVGFVPGGYACVLQAQLDGELRTLASVGFQVVEPPIKVAADMALGGRGRLLVLLDKPGQSEDPHGPESAPGLAAQRAFLEDLLTEAGWSYTLTESADAFTRELRTGGYAVYALFSEQEKLSTQVQKELREAVFRGEGLVIAGAHDSRNHGQYEALGVKFIGHLSHTNTVVLSSAEFPLLHGEFSVLAQEKPERIERAGAEKVGVYGLSGPDAVTLNTYGMCEAAFAGTDLLAIATRDGQSSLAAELLRILLERVHPASLATDPGSVVPVQLTVANQGIAVPITASVALPAGMSVIDPGMGVVSGQTLSFAFPLAVDEVKTVRFWVKLPELSGSVTLRAVVNAGEGSTQVSVTSTVVLAVTPIRELDSLQASLDGLVGAGHPDAKLLKRASSFVGKALANPVPAQALSEVLQATDVLLGLSDPRIVEVRVGLDVWLRWAAQQAG